MKHLGRERFMSELIKNIPIIETLYTFITYIQINGEILKEYMHIWIQESLKSDIK